MNINYTIVKIATTPCTGIIILSNVKYTINMCLLRDTCALLFTISACYKHSWARMKLGRWPTAFAQSTNAHLVFLLPINLMVSKKRAHGQVVARMFSHFAWCSATCSYMIQFLFLWRIVIINTNNILHVVAFAVSTKIGYLCKQKHFVSIQCGPSNYIVILSL